MLGPAWTGVVRGDTGTGVAMLLKRNANWIDGQGLAANDRIARRSRMAVYEQAGTRRRAAQSGDLASRLRTSHGPAGPRQAMIRALPQLGGFA